jgi:hypothetical protein
MGALSALSKETLRPHLLCELCAFAGLYISPRRKARKEEIAKIILKQALGL